MASETLTCGHYKQEEKRDMQNKQTNYKDLTTTIFQIRAHGKTNEYDYVAIRDQYIGMLSPFYLHFIELAEYCLPF